MQQALAAIPAAFRHLFRDPVNLVLMLFPGVLAMALYLVVGGTLIKNGLAMTEGLINKYGVAQEHGAVAYYLMAGLLGFLFLVLVSWTFVIIVSVLAAPFNVVIGSRIERKIRGDLPSVDRAGGLREAFRGLLQSLFNELKKLTVIIALTVAAVGLNFVPVLFPLAFLLLALLMSAQFLDYAWSRHDLAFGNCVRDLLGSPFAHAFAGAAFLMLVTIPLLNALVPALATSYYTVLWTNRQIAKS